VRSGVVVPTRTEGTASSSFRLSSLSTGKSNSNSDDGMIDLDDI